jgi:hypothetical protein
MTPVHTLVSLACLIANNGAIDSGALDAQLTVKQKQQVVEVINSGACLPENLEKLLRKTKETGLDKNMMRHAPSDACFQ